MTSIPPPPPPPSRPPGSPSTRPPRYEDDVFERLAALLSRYGSKPLARMSVRQAVMRVCGSVDRASPQQLDRVIEEAMTGFRVFCDPAQRAQLWIDLMEFCERERVPLSWRPKEPPR